VLRKTTRSEHSNAMHQFTMWTALEAEGLGCNLQHYNPLIDNKAKEHWGLDMEWSLKAQLVFGGLGEGARDNLKERTHPELDQKLKVFGKQ
jgi:predicted oxidoreductase (fatty acid repression mutant protein)